MSRAPPKTPYGPEHCENKKRKIFPLSIGFPSNIRGDRSGIKLKTRKDEDLQHQCDVLQEHLWKEEAEKLDALNSYIVEKERRETIERLKDELSNELSRSNKDLEKANQKIESLEDIYKKAQVYISNLQQYNITCEARAFANTDATKRLQRSKYLQLKEEKTNVLQSNIDLLQAQFIFAETSRQQIENEKEKLQSIHEGLLSELEELSDDRNARLAEIQSLKSDLEWYDDEQRKLCDMYDDGLRSVMKSLMHGSCFSQEDPIHVLQTKLDSANSKLQQVEDLQKQLDEAKLKILDGETLRKKLHNTILELKGNIRVFCRVRPLLQDNEHGEFEENILSFPTSTGSLGRCIDLMHNGKKQSFTFDKIFDSTTSQESVFGEVSELVQSVVDGYKVCIFAYGQTGSGKTYTMMGRPEKHELKGLIPRSVEKIYETIESLLSLDWEYKTMASMLEIYNDSIRDLLAPRTTNAADKGKRYRIKRDRNGNTVVSDLTVESVCTMKDVLYLLEQAAQNRSVSTTLMNEQSSRSHFIFCLQILGRNKRTGQELQGVLNLIDLAGSERLDKSGATGERLKETQHINRSLLSLSEVISSIASKRDHIPFRNSKLTYLLQPYLSGNSKTLMIVNISPESSSSEESKCSLQFASNVNSCEIGAAQRHSDA